MIVKDEVKGLKRVIESINQVMFDELVIGFGSDGSKEMGDFLLHRKDIKVIPIKWTNNFGEARNKVLSETTADLVMWLDTDDVLVNPEQVREVCENAFKYDRVTSLWCDYQYDTDLTFCRERIILRGSHEWVGIKHETLQPLRDGVRFVTDKFHVKHDFDITSQERQLRALRALSLSKKVYEDEKKSGKFQTLTVLDYARACQSTNNFNLAIELYQEFISITDDTYLKALALIRLSDTYRKFGHYNEAIDMDLVLLRSVPEIPDSYIGLGMTYYCMENWSKAILFLEMGLKFPVPYGFIPIEKSKYTYKPQKMLAFSYFYSGNIDKALESVTETFKYQPKDEEMTVLKEACDRFNKEKAMIESLGEVKKELEADKIKNAEKLKHLCQCLPDCVEDQPMFIYLKNKYNPKHDKNVITIYCGDAVRPWGPESISEGIGGSEEAVINMSAKLTSLGWLVKVYNKIPKSGIVDGVQWRNYWEYNKEEPCDIFIAWRRPEYLELAPPSSRKFLWVHDLQAPTLWTPKRVELVEKIFALSKFHRENMSFIPDDNKFMITRNGILPEHFPYTDKTERSPFSFIYASSPDRGLENVLDIWPDIRKKFPIAVFHIYYGFDKSFNVGSNAHPFFHQLKERIMKKIEELKNDGVFYHGRVSHMQVADAFLTASWWIYPCFNFGEISCINAMKAQASGCWPITTDCGALAETVKYGEKVHGDLTKAIPMNSWNDIEKAKFLKKVLDVVDKGIPYEKRKEMSDWARKFYRWDEVAVSWDEVFRATKTA
jgi:glycosyltransferase involved in cell wall biosynthesis